MQALILAAGLGTRMRPLTDNIPKVMLPVNGRPFLEILLEKIADQNIGDIIIATSYLSDKIEDYFKNGAKWGVSIKYSRSPEVYGTGGTIKYAEDLLDDSFLVFNGDSYSKFDYRDFYAFHEKNGFDVSVSLVFAKDASRYGLVELGANNAVKKFSEKSDKKEGGYINSGVYAMKKGILKDFKKNAFISIEEDVFPSAVSQNKVGGYAFNDYFIDIGTFESYDIFINDCKKGII